MDKIYHVFVSSTYSDLEKERRQVADTLAKAGFVSEGMELFPAADQEALQFIERVIDRCDYYVVIIGGRYGSLADDNVSFTEKEYEYALSKGIPVLAFLHAEPDNIPVAKTDIEPTKAAKLKAFRDRLARGRLVRTWRTVHDLCTEVVISSINESNRRPGIGWVRGDQAIDPKVLQETERLRVENTELKRRLAEGDGDEIRFPPHLAGPEEQFEFTVSAAEWDTAPNRKLVQKEETTVSLPIGDVFIRSFDRLLVDHTEMDLQHMIGEIVAEMVALRRYDSITISRKNITQLRFHLEALGLITAQTSQNNRYQISWVITDKGRSYVLQFRAIRKKG